MPAFVSGLSFLQPAALWALAALLIPVLIHLFNRSRGRLVKIGHINLIRNARQLKVTELKLADWLLLLLRMCLFALAALILAGLALPGLSSSDKATAYVSPAWLLNAQSQAVTDLLKRYSVEKTSRIFLLQDDFPVLDRQAVDLIREPGAIQQISPASSLKNPVTAVNITNIWPLLAERLSLEDHQGVIEVYALDNLAQFGYSRPSLPRQVTWNLSHLEGGTAGNSSSITAVVAYDSQHKADAELLNAALSSLRAQRLPGLRWRLIEIEKLAAEQQAADWLFLLSDSPAINHYPSTIASPKVVVTDAYGESGDGASRQVRLPFYPFSQFRVSRTGNAVDDQHTLLSSNHNRPLIQQSGQGVTRRIHFNTRFDPTWSSVALQPEFPELLLQLLMADKLPQISFADARVLPAQLQAASSPHASMTRLPRRSLQALLAALMVLVWLPERWLSERKSRAPL